MTQFEVPNWVGRRSIPTELEHTGCHVKIMQLFISLCCSPSCCRLVLLQLNLDLLNLNKLIICISFPAVRFKSHHRHQLCCRGRQDPCREPPPDARAERERGAAADTEGGGGEVSLEETFVILLLPLNTDWPVTFFLSLCIWQWCCCWCLFSRKLWFLFSETTSYDFFQKKTPMKSVCNNMCGVLKDRFFWALKLWTELEKNEHCRKFPSAFTNSLNRFRFKPLCSSSTLPDWERKRRNV